MEIVKTEQELKENYSKEQQEEVENEQCKEQVDGNQYCKEQEIKNEHCKEQQDVLYNEDRGKKQQNVVNNGDYDKEQQDGVKNEDCDKEQSDEIKNEDCYKEHLNGIKTENCDKQPNEIKNEDDGKEQSDEIKDDNCGEQPDGIKDKACDKEPLNGVRNDDCIKEQQDTVKNKGHDKKYDIKNNNYDKEQQDVIKIDNQSKEQQHMKKSDRELQDMLEDSGCVKEQQGMVKKGEHDSQQLHVTKDGYAKEQQDGRKKDNCVKEQQDMTNDNCDNEQDVVMRDDLVKKQHQAENVNCHKIQDVKKKDDVKEQQNGIKIEEIVQSSYKKNFQNNSSRIDENEETYNVKNEKSDKINEYNKKITPEKELNSDNNSRLPRVVDKNSRKLQVKGRKVHSMRKLREVSQILRNKRRSRQREQIRTRHRSSSKDIAKLFKKKRKVYRQQSTTSLDDDQSIHLGTKRKRIPNRPGILFEIGARIEAKDYLDKWYPSKIIAVDEDAAEVLIHFERWSSRFDEWMPMESPRIRAITHPSTRNEQKEKTNKVMPQYKAGEAVLARWTDCKMYPAKVLEVGANNCYEVLFYDGFHRTVQSLNIEKLPREMIDKVDFPSAPKSESPERKKSNPLPKDIVKSPPKKVDKAMKDKPSKRDQNDLTSILGKRKRLIVGGIFQAKRNKINDEKYNSSLKQKTKNPPLPTKESTLETIESSSTEEATSPVSPTGYIHGRKIARKEFIIEEDHNHFKCPVTSCGKSFRKDKLLQSHMKHYHDDSRSREKKKSPSIVRDSKTVISPPSIPVSPPCEKILEKEESKTEILKTKLKTPTKEEASKEMTKSNNTQLTTSPKVASKPNIQESLKSGKVSKSRIDAKHNKTANPEISVDNKMNAVKPDGRVTRSEKAPKIDHKTTRIDTKLTRAETRSSKLENKFTKMENKNIKTENKITKAESKATKIENRVVKTENKAIKSENKIIKSENKTIKNENKTVKCESKIIKTENKLIEEKLEKSKIGQENKIAAEEVATISTLPVVEDTKIIDNGINVTSTTQVPILPTETAHTSRSKKRRTTSASEVNIETSPLADNIIHSGILKEIDIKSEQKFVDIENLQDDVKPMVTDFKSTVQEEDVEEGQSDEIVHCICNCIEENGLMMQCEVCLTWQHGACFDIDDVKEVPDKYVCYACLKPVGLRESFRYRHDLDWFNKGEMTTFSFLDEKPSPNVVNETLSAHDLVASLHNAMSVLHSLQIKLKLAKEDNHPDLIMWKKPWMDYSYMHCQELDNNEELIQPTRADFDHSYFSVKEDLLMTTNALSTRRNSYDKVNKKEGSASSIIQDGETSQIIDKNKTNVNGTKCRSIDKEKISGKQQSFVKTEIKQSVEFDPSECKKNLLDHLIQMQHGVEQQLNIIEEHVQILESEMGIPALSDEDLQKEMGKSLCTIRKLMKDLSFVQQLTNFQ